MKLLAGSWRRSQGKKKYTKAIKQTIAAIEDENKAQDKQLSGLDKLNNLSSKSGGANDSGAAGTMFEEVPLGDSFKNISQWLRNMWESADFTDLGAAIGKKLKSALDGIPWKNIKNTAKNIGSSIATLINGGIEASGLGYSIGNTLVQLINTGFEYFNTFVHGLHWDSVGTFIADSLNGFFENIDWDLVRDTFITGVKGLGESINSFIDDFNWDNISDTISGFVDIVAESMYKFFSTIHWEELGQELGSQLTETIKKINWEEVGAAIGSVIQLALDFLTGFVGGLEFEEAAQAVIDALKGAFETVDMELLAKTVLALLAAKMALNATAALFKSAGIAILNAIKGAIVSSVGTISGIASSILGEIGAAFTSLGGIGGILTADLSTIMGAGTAAEIGLTIGTGILAGIASAVAGFNLGKWLGKQLFPDDTEFYDNFKWLGEGGFFDTIASDWKTSFEALDQMITDFSNNKFIQFLNGDISGLMGKEHKTWKETKEEIVNAIAWIKDEASREWEVFMGNLDTISDWYENSVKPWFTKEKWLELFKNIKTSLKEVWDKTVGQWATDISAWWEKHVAPWFTIEKWKEILNSVPEAFSSAFANAVDAVKEKIQGVIDWVVDKVDWLKEKIGGIKDAFSGITPKVGGFFSGGFSSSIFSTASHSFASPSMASLPSMEIPKLATGAVIPANREFLAVLGDQKHGTNIEAPLDTIKQANEEAILNVFSKLGISSGNNRNSGNETFVFQVDGRTFFEIMRGEAEQYFQRTGRAPFPI